MEDYAIREREKEKARELLAKIKLQEESLAKIKEHLFVFHPTYPINNQPKI